MNKNKGIIAKKENYTVEVKYSKKSQEEKLVRFTLLDGKSFEISADELIGILTHQVNVESLAPVFIETKKVDVVEVGRQLRCVLDKDMKAGQEININYSHPYPLEFALLEEAYKIAKIDESVPRIEITTEYLEEVKTKLKPEQEEYINNFYKSFKNVKI